MKISNQNSGYTRQNFKAVPKGSVSPIIDGIKKEIKFYRITPEDYPFLEEMKSKINMAKLLPSKFQEMCSKGQKESFNEWQKMIDDAITYAIDGDSCIIGAHNNKPCSIVTYNEGTNGVSTLYRIASWPVSVNMPVKLSGKGTMRQFIETEKRHGIKKIMLNPLLCGPTDTVSFYKECGYKNWERPISGLHMYGIDFKTNCTKLDETLHYASEKNKNSVNLFNELSLDYYS